MFLHSRKWWIVNACARYTFLPRNSLTLRVEHFDDPYAVLVKPVTDAKGYKVSAASVGYNLQVTQDAMLRVEARYFGSPYGLFPLRDGTDASGDGWFTVGLTAHLR